jgi:hypothetical protein
MATQQSYDQNHDQDKPEYPADAITTTAAIITTALIPEAASKQEGQQDGYEKRSITVSPPFSDVESRGGSQGSNEPLVSVSFEIHDITA